MHRLNSIHTAAAPILLILSGVSSAFGAEDLSGYSGTDLYTRYCASCHGLHGEGDGPVAPFFKLQPPDLTKIARRRGGEFPSEEIHKIIDGRQTVAPHGTRSMPVWGLEFAFAQGGAQESDDKGQTLITRLVDYLRAIQKR
jgi:mono/diheme cytochrome c family protein